jgi:hypothetical protein
VLSADARPSSPCERPTEHSVTTRPRAAMFVWRKSSVFFRPLLFRSYHRIAKGKAFRLKEIHTMIAEKRARSSCKSKPIVEGVVFGM